jgi:hypothetical protein
MTGSVPRKKDNPGVPVTPSEQIESTHQSFDAGPSFVHIHVRKPDETPASDRILFCSGARGRAQTLSLDDHSIFDWRSPTGRRSTWKRSLPQTGHGLALNRLRELPDQRL